MTEVLNWGMTPGMGDAMMALNCAHRWSFMAREHLVLNLHWFHGKDHRHHPEDAETIVERVDYIKNLYMKSDVEINHVFNSNRLDLTDTYTRFDWFNPRVHRDTNSWMFDPSVLLPTNKNKIVIWRSLFNAETPRYWKRTVKNKDWDLIINNYKEIGYEVIELCYKTPIREATYHINTCNFIVCYDGMWHYIARNFMKPMLISSHDEITRYHTRQALPIGHNKFVKWAYNIHTPIYNKNKKEMISPYDWMHKRASIHHNIFWKKINDYRQSSN